MIYSLAEYCLNCLNGTFFKSADTIMASNQKYASYAPYVSIYVALIGVNTLDISVVLSQIMFLYNFFHKINESFIGYVNKTFPGSYPETIIHFPIIPVLMAVSLHIAHISPAKKCRSLLSRILHSTVSHTISILFNDSTFTWALNFVLSYVIVTVFLKFYSSQKFHLSALILAFCGTYFFLKTYTKSPILEQVLRIDANFNINPKELPSTQSLVLYCTFLLIMGISFLTQRIIGQIVYKRKSLTKQHQL